MFIPGFLISMLTFPGVIVHEYAHMLFCRLFRVAIFEVCYIRWGNPAGYVIHEIPRKQWQHILIGVGPFFVNTILGGLIAAPAAIPVIKFGTGTPLDFLLIYLGVSIAMHAFPSTGDAKSMWNAIWKEKSSLGVKIAVTPIVGIIMLGALGSMMWLDLAYGVGIAVGLPNLIIYLAA
ncbi:MAG TPA: metalloprotease family protein [Bacteroidia bacterium]|jgi:hypothetical protein|nr:metalloprotease family protein [Bacteroidia bacterium]